MRYQIIPVTPFQQNCTILWSDTPAGRIGAVADPGGDLDRVLDFVARNGIRLERILVTHGHLDHAGGVAELAERLGLPVEGPHVDDTFWIERMADSARAYGFPPARAFTPDRWLRQGDQVSLGPLTLDVLHCPGHTPGHVVFYHAASRLALVGDVLFRGSIGRTDFPRGNFEQLIQSITQRLWPLGDDTTFIPGHGPVSTFGWERKTNPFVCDLALSTR
ncbi:MAG: MBL fold metallo-hydrolase [Alphaproteobacteria bacterium]|nr:MBL fold metallo-hydrolase [Alphaproteobacteria bacterium]